MKTGLVASQRGTQTITTASAGRSFNLLFDPTNPDHSVPSMGEYSSTTGGTLLPQGPWLFCFSCLVTFLNNPGNQVNNARMFPDFLLRYGNFDRHGQSGYMRGAVNARYVASDLFSSYWVSVPGAVIYSDGSTRVFVHMDNSAQQDGATFKLEAAHLHAYRQIN